MKNYNSKIIFIHILDCMKDLKEDKITVEQAKAHAGLAKQANNILKHELDRAKTLDKYDRKFREIEN